MTAPTSPDVFAHDDGNITTTLIARPSWLYAWRTTALEDGVSWMSVYRSALLRDDGGWLDLLREFITDELLHREVIEDAAMMYDEGELSIYKVAA